MKKTLSNIGILLLLAACSGGGGSGGGGGGGSNGAPPPDPKGPVSLRALQNGDHWSYVVSGSVDLFLPGSSAPTSGVAFSGTMDRWVDMTAPTHLIHNELVMFASGGSTQTGSDTFFVQDAAGSLTYLGDTNAVTGRTRNAPSPGYLRFKSPMQVGDQGNLGPIAFDDGSTLSVNYTVAAIETVSVPAGKFNAYRVDTTEVNTNPTNTVTLTQTGSYWIDPQVGIVQYKGTETKKNSSGTVLYVLYLSDDPNTSQVENYGFQLTLFTPAGAIPVAAPRGVLVAPSPSPGGIALSWDNVPNATGYIIYRPNRSGDGPSPQNKIGPVPSNAFTDTTVIAGQTYYYLVSAVGPAGEGPPSVEVSAQVQIPSASPDWSTQRSGTTAPLTAISAKPDLSNPLITHLFASGGACNVIDFLVLCGGVLIHSADGGATWTPQRVDPMTMLTGLFFSDAQHGWAVGENGVIQATSDGSTWLPQASPVLQNLTGVYFLDNSNGWAVGFGGTVLHTSNGGVTWAAQNAGTSNLLNAVMFADPSHGWAVGSGATTGTNCQGQVGLTVGCASLFATTNGGQTWFLVNTGTIDINYHALSFINATTGWVSGAGGMMLNTTDGTTWTEQPTADSSLHGLFFLDALNGWSVGWGSIVHTSNGGVAVNGVPGWQIQYGPNPFDTYQGKTLLLAVTALPGSPTSVFAVGWSGTILASANGQF